MRLERETGTDVWFCLEAFLVDSRFPRHHNQVLGFRD